MLLTTIPLLLASDMVQYKCVPSVLLLELYSSRASSTAGNGHLLIRGLLLLQLFDRQGSVLTFCTIPRLPETLSLRVRDSQGRAAELMMPCRCCFLCGLLDLGRSCPADSGERTQSSGARMNDREVDATKSIAESARRRGSWCEQLAIIYCPTICTLFCAMCRATLLWLLSCDGCVVVLVLLCCTATTSSERYVLRYLTCQSALCSHGQGYPLAGVMLAAMMKLCTGRPCQRSASVARVCYWEALAALTRT